MESEGEEDLGEFKGEACEKIKVGQEGEEVRKLVDPKLPTQPEVAMHWLKGHV